MAARASRRFVPIRSTADFTRDRERERESCYRMGKERREKKGKARGRESDTTWHRPIGSIISSFHANSAPNIRFLCGGEENPILAIGFSLTFRNYVFIAA